MLKISQYISFCGLGAQHKNGTTKNYTRKVVKHACTALLHAQRKCNDVITLDICPLSMRNVVDTCNVKPRDDINWNNKNIIFSVVHLCPDSQQIRLKKYYAFGFPV